MGPPVPVCVGCDPNNSQGWPVLYADSRNDACPSDKPYRQMAGSHTKYYCENGGYWWCNYDSTLICTTYKAKPDCPSDTCLRQ
jgi:hypothetical protein